MFRFDMRRYVLARLFPFILLYSSKKSKTVCTLAESIVNCLCYLVTDTLTNYVLSEPFETLVHSSSRTRERNG